MRIKVLRRIVQLCSLALIAAMPVLNLRGIKLLSGSLYSLAIGPVWITDPLAGLQVIVLTLSVTGMLLVSILIPIVLALALGRVFCSWACPQNALSELADFLSRKLGIKRFFSVNTSPVPRYVVLGLLLILAPVVGFPVANLLSAPGIISTQISRYAYEGTVGIEVSLIVIILLAETFLLRRAWCNYVCPVGGLLGLFRIGKTLKVAYREDAVHVCGRCFECVRACGLGLNPMEGKIYPLCHNCGDCVAACSKITAEKSPLLFRF